MAQIMEEYFFSMFTVLAMAWYITLQERCQAPPVWLLFLTLLIIIKTTHCQNEIWSIEDRKSHIQEKALDEGVSCTLLSPYPKWFSLMVLVL